MPLEHSSTDAARGRNIGRLRHEGYPPKQAAAIAYRTQRAAKRRRKGRRNPADDVGAAIGYLTLGGLIGAGAGAITNLSAPAPAALSGAEVGIAFTGVGGLVVAIFNPRARGAGIATAGIGLGGLVLLGLVSNLIPKATTAA